MNFGLNSLSSTPQPGITGSNPNMAGIGFQNPMFDQTGLMMQQMMSQMMVMMQALMQQLMSASGAVSGGGAFGGASPAGGSGVGNFLGGSSGTGATSGASSAAVAPGTGQKGTGQAAVDLARKYLGRDSISLKGDMPHFTAAGGVTNNCVDFVSSALESQGLVKGHHINVRAFEKELQKQGWVQVPVAQAKPGDVWINHSRGHTELVATAGATRLIGSNGSARQKVSEHANNPSSGVIYQKR